jgi:predicted nucleic acid-binding Zn ribbon protein
VEQRITADPLNACQCGKEGTVKRIIQPTAVMFKGGGFYVNDTGTKSEPIDCTGDKSSCACSTTPATGE